MKILRFHFSEISNSNLSKKFKKKKEKKTCQFKEIEIDSFSGDF